MDNMERILSLLNGERLEKTELAALVGGFSE